MDVFVPVYKEPVEIVDLTVAAAAGLRGAEVRVWVLDDGNDDAMRDLAARHGVGYIRREEHTGAKAGNINNALALTDAPFIAVFDSDHVADPAFLEATLGHMEDPKVAFVQTPQYYANSDGTAIAAASWAQQALFFGAIARGKDGLGRGVLLRHQRAVPPHGVRERRRLPHQLADRGLRALDPPAREGLEVGLHARGAVARARAGGHGRLRLPAAALGPRAACRACRARCGRKLPLKLKVQYMLSASYFLSGWTVLIYMSFPVVRLLGGGQPLAGIDAPEFLLHFAPYFAVALTTAALAGAGSYTFAAFALAAANFWIHILSTIFTVLRRKGSFVVTPKKGAAARQPGGGDAGAGGRRDPGRGQHLRPDRRTRTRRRSTTSPSPPFHVSVLMTGCWPALAKPPAPTAGDRRARRGGGLSRHAACAASLMCSRSALGGAVLSSARLRRRRVRVGAPTGAAARAAGPPSRRQALPRPLRDRATAACRGSTRAATPSARGRPTGC